MKIVIFSHPLFFNSKSMSVYIQMLTEGMKKKGHEVNVWMPKARFYNLPVPLRFKKWLGYIDQFVIFPIEVKRRIKTIENTIYVFSDNALGPWVPLVANRPHVIHCHDFLALNSGMGNVAENKTSWSGRKYQSLIRNGYLKGKNFISVSMKTREELHKIIVSKPEISEVVYNGVNKIFKPLDSAEQRRLLSHQLNLDLNQGYLLHIGSNLWYKNRKGVVEMYLEWRKKSKLSLPLLLVGEPLNDEISGLINNSENISDIFILNGISDQTVHQLYAGASVFLFPSLDEGFGWPIAEAMACGCPVITTNKAPMNEVGGKAAYYISRRPLGPNETKSWAVNAADVIEKVLTLNESERNASVEAGLSQVRQFDLDLNIDKIETIYKQVLLQSN